MESTQFANLKRLQLSSFRTAALTLASLPIVLLATASQLTPSPSGLGTHQQLGLPPCTMRVVAGIRCPGCGMTTSWAHFAKGQWNASIAANFGGFLLAIYGIAFALMSGTAAWSGRMPGVEVQRILAIALLAIAVVTLATWAVSFLC